MLNAPSSKVVFSRLQPISFNVDHMVDSDEERLFSEAERCAPVKRTRDPKVSLKDFLDCVVISKLSIVPDASFIEICSRYHINLFNQHGIYEDLPLVSYIFWNAN